MRGGGRRLAPSSLRTRFRWDSPSASKGSWPDNNLSTTPKKATGMVRLCVATTGASARGARVLQRVVGVALANCGDQDVDCVQLLLRAPHVDWHEVHAGLCRAAATSNKGPKVCPNPAMTSLTLM